MHKLVNGYERNTVWIGSMKNGKRDEELNSIISLIPWEHELQLC